MTLPADADREAESAAPERSAADGSAGPSLPDNVPPIGAGLGGLSHASPAGAISFLAEGERAWVEGMESRPGFRVGTGDVIVASVSPTDVGTAANVLLFPGVVRRDFAGSRGTCVETLLVATALPLVVTQWSSEAGGGPTSIVVELPGPDAPKAVARHRSVVSVERGPEQLALGLAPDAASIDVGETPDGTVRIVFTPKRSSDGTALVVAYGGKEAVRSAFSAAAHAPAHAVRAASGPNDGILLHTGIAEVDDGVRWLRSRLGGAIARHAMRPGSGPKERGRDRERLLSLGLAAVGVGDRAGAARLLAEAGPRGRVSRHPGAAEAHGPVRRHPPDAERAVVAARFGSVFGDPSHASAIARVWSRGGRAEGPLHAFAAILLARALDRSEPADLIAALRRRAASTGEVPAARDEAPRTSGESGTSGAERREDVGGERRLPMAGSVAEAEPERGDPSGPDRARWLESLLSGEPAAPAPNDLRASVTEARRACARFRTDPDGAWSAWRGLLSRPSEATGSRVLWDDPRAGGGSLTVELLDALAYGLLGLDADAPAGRVRIAPRIPSHLTSLAVSGIPVGRCAIRMSYERSGGLYRFELTPEVAPVPPLAVFEPAVRGRVRAIRIDGTDADLDVRMAGDWTIVPSQLPIDGARRIEIDAE